MAEMTIITSLLRLLYRKNYRGCLNGSFLVRNIKYHTVICDGDFAAIKTLISKNIKFFEKFRTEFVIKQGKSVDIILTKTKIIYRDTCSGEIIIYKALK